MYRWRKLRGENRLILHSTLNGDDGDDDDDCVCVCVCHHSYAESVGAKHYHTSAKLNKGIEELFLDLCKSKTTCRKML